MGAASGVGGRDAAIGVRDGRGAGRAYPRPIRIPSIFWWAAGIVCLGGAILAGVRHLPLAVGLFLLAAVVFAGLGWVQRGAASHTPFTPALIAADRAVVFWKDGCLPCHRLIRAMRGDDRVTWVNVFRDRAGDARVRELNGGDQLTPTAVVGEKVLRNPSARELRAALDAAGAGAMGAGPTDDTGPDAAGARAASPRG